MHVYYCYIYKTLISSPVAIGPAVCGWLFDVCTSNDEMNIFFIHEPYFSIKIVMKRSYKLDLPDIFLVFSTFSQRAPLRVELTWQGGNFSFVFSHVHKLWANVTLPAFLWVVHILTSKEWVEWHLWSRTHCSSYSQIPTLVILIVEAKSIKFLVYVTS